MSVYRKNLWRLGIALIIITVIDLTLNLVTMRLLISRVPANLSVFLPQFAVAFVKDALCLLSGWLACRLHRRNRQHKWVIRMETLLLVISIGIILFSINGNVDNLIDAPLIIMCMILYTMVQMQQGDRLWERISRLAPADLDLKLSGGDQWFDPIVMGPHLELNDNISHAVDRFLATARTSRPLQISVQGMGPVSEAKQEIMREIYVAHYEDEERRVNHYLEGRYGRAMMLIIVSLIAVWIFVKVPRQEANTATWTILSNYAGFSLWQIGTTHFERSEGFQELQRMNIARKAKIEFLG